MNERLNNLVRINKTDAEIMYYNGMGVILNAKNINPFHPMGNTNCLRFIEQKEGFDKILGHFTFYNGEAWYWTDKQNKELLDSRKASYKKLKSYNQICKLYNIEVSKPVTASDWRKQSSNDIYNCINIIYDYIIKYKPTSRNCLTDKEEVKQLDCFLSQFNLDEKIYYKQLFKIMKQIGFN